MINQGIIQEQKQFLNITPKMYQSFKILQMNLTDLCEWLEKESHDNPFLEIDSIYQNKVADNNEDREKEHSKTEDYKKILAKIRNDEDGKLSSLSESKINIYSKKNAFIENTISIDNIKSNEVTTLNEHLLMCANITIKDDIDFKIAEYLIGNINQSGYLDITCFEAAHDLNISQKRVKKVLAIIQNLSIPGLGARDLRECLLIQLKQLEIEQKNSLKMIISNYLTELSEKKYNVISKKVKMTYYEIQKLHELLIRNFEPKPGRYFYQNNYLNITIPDFIIKKFDETYEIVENKDYFPSIRFNSFYIKLLKRKEKCVDRDNQTYGINYIEQQKVFEYLEKKIKSAQWIVRCIEQRRKTIFEIINFIIIFQKDFIEKGVLYLKPLSLKTVADNLDLHESTVSRAISGKKIQLPRGTYDIKYFFSKGISQENERIISSEKIKHIIKNNFETENPFYPYTDQEMANLLQKKEKINISRRTIAKYRNILGISSAKYRRRFKK